MQALDYKKLSIRLVSAALESRPYGMAFAILYCGAVIDTSQALLYEWGARDGELELAVFDATLPVLANLPVPAATGGPTKRTLPPAHQSPANPESWSPSVRKRSGS